MPNHLPDRDRIERDFDAAVRVYYDGHAEKDALSDFVAPDIMKLRMAVVRGEPDAQANLNAAEQAIREHDAKLAAVMQTIEAAHVQRQASQAEMAEHLRENFDHYADQAEAATQAARAAMLATRSAYEEARKVWEEAQAEWAPIATAFGWRPADPMPDLGPVGFADVEAQRVTARPPQLKMASEPVYADDEVEITDL